MKFTTTLLKLNEVNLNGRIYQNNDNLREAIEEYNSKQFQFGEIGFSDNFDTSLNNVSHVVDNVRIEDNLVLGDVTILSTDKGKILKDLLNIDNNVNNNVVFRSKSSGVVGDGGVVTLRKLHSFDVVNSNEDPFNQANFERFNQVKDSEETIGRQIFSDIDPYGEEKWEY